MNFSTCRKNVMLYRVPLLTVATWLMTCLMLCYIFLIASVSNPEHKSRLVFFPVERNGITLSEKPLNHDFRFPGSIGRPRSSFLTEIITQKLKGTKPGVG